MKHEDESDWTNLEIKLDQAMNEIMLSDLPYGAPSLGVLLSMFRRPGDVPEAAHKRATRMLEILHRDPPEELGGLLRGLDGDLRHELAGEMIGLLRFVCHRGRR